MPFQGSTIATTEAELWGLQDSAERAAVIWSDVAVTGADLGGPQDGVFGQLNDVGTELNASGGPRGWLPGLLAAILGLIFGSVAWLNQGLDNWLQWAKNNAVDGFNDWLEGMRALIEAGPQAAINAIQGLVVAMQRGDADANAFTTSVWNMTATALADDRAAEHADVQNLQNNINSQTGAVLQQEQVDVHNLQNNINSQTAAVLQQEQADFGNLHNLIDQNFFTLQQQEQADTQNLQKQINPQTQPQLDALQSLVALQVLPQLSTLTQTATATADQLRQDEQNCIDPMCQNLSDFTRNMGLLNGLGVAAAVIAFIAACMSDPGGVAGAINGAVTGVVDGTVSTTTGVS